MKLAMVETHHDNGNIETRYYIDEQGRKQGIEEGFKEDGETLLHKTTYVDGKRHGNQEVFYEAGKRLCSIKVELKG